MFGEQREKWRTLCEKIAEEQNPARFSELVQQLLAELEAKDQRLKDIARAHTSQQPPDEPEADLPSK